MAYPKVVRRYAEQLYVLQGLSLSQAAHATGVSPRQITNWAKTYRRRRKRLEYNDACEAVERDLPVLRSRVIAKAMETLEPGAIAAAARIIGVTLVANDPWSLPMEDEPGQADSPKETIAAMQRIIDRRLRMGAIGPGTMTKEAVRELRDTLELLERLKKRFKCLDDKPKGLSTEMAEEIRRKILGIKPDTEEEKGRRFFGSSPEGTWME